MEEIWKDIHGYEGLYQVSNLGNVKSLHYGKKTDHLNWKNQPPRLLRQKVSTSGYLRVELYRPDSRKNFYVHRLVALAFIPNCENKNEVNHIDGNKLNNNADNLEWVSRSENQVHALKMGLNKPPMTGVNSYKCPASKPVLQYSLNGEFVKLWYSAADAARYLNIHPSGISNCATGRYKTCCGYKWKIMEGNFIPKRINV